MGACVCYFCEKLFYPGGRVQELPIAEEKDVEHDVCACAVVTGEPLYECIEIFAKGLQYGQQRRQVLFEVVEGLVAVVDYNGLAEQYFSTVFADGAAGGVGRKLVYLVPFLLGKAQVEAMFFWWRRGCHIG